MHHTEAKAALQGLMREHGITVASVFVPLSRVAPERRKDWGDALSLNWQCTIKRGERVILTTDYTQGIGHAPSDSMRFPDSWLPIEKRRAKRTAHEHEAETGRIASYGSHHSGVLRSNGLIPPPDPADVFYSLLMDCDVLESGGFENWAADLGYDTDSRKAERTFAACVDIAVKLMGALGADVLRAARDFAREM